MTVVAVTGISGHLGRAFAARLDEREDVRRVVGIDLVDGPPGRRTEFYRLDVRSEALPDVLRGCDVVVHLAYVVSPMHDETEMRDINVGGTRNVLHAATQAGVSQVVYASSVMAYGAHADNDFPLTEASPIRPVRDFSYSAHEGECEELLDAFRESQPRVTTTVLRAGVVLGPGVSGMVGQLVEAPLVPGIDGYEVPIQAVHVDDAARALVHAIDHRLDGAFNVAPEDHISPQRWAEMVGRRRVSMPYARAKAWTDRSWTMGLSPVPSSYLPFLMYPWVMTSRKLTDTGFAFEHGTADAFHAAVDARAGRVSIGRFRFDPRRVAAVAAGGLVAGTLARRVGRRRRSV